MGKSRILTSEMLIDVGLPQILRERFWIEHGGELEITTYTRFFLNKYPHAEMFYRKFSALLGVSAHRQFMSTVGRMENELQETLRRINKAYEHKQLYALGNSNSERADYLQHAYKTYTRESNVAIQQHASNMRIAWNTAFIEEARDG